MHALIALWFGWVRDWGYAGVVVLMALESTIVPVPSEVVIPPAAYWVAQGHMSLLGVVLAGTLGSFLGSAASYWVARGVGRFAVTTYGKRFLLTEEKFERAERFLQRYGAGGVFFARLLPVVRHLVSIPAGILRMGFLKFSVFTIVGSALWCGVLAWLGARVSERNPGLMDSPEDMIHAVKHESLSFVGAVVVLAVLYVVTMRLTARRSVESPL
jgi:membrane protein DedA with SNARE-associated domain